MNDHPISIGLSPRLTRRLALGGALFGGAALAGAPPRARATTADTTASGLCRITPQVTQGPYWIDPKLERSDITEGRAGVPLRLAVSVVDAATCRPFERARVDIWHCDAQGVYSGFDRQPGAGSTVGQTFLRGHVFTGSDGVARFETIYPGWYSGRTPHIHVKVFLDDGGAENLLTCQLFFPDALSEFIYLNEPSYKRSQARDTLNRYDDIAQQQGYANFGAVSEQADHYAMTVTLGVDRTARSVEEQMGPPPGQGQRPGQGQGQRPGSGERPSGPPPGPPPGDGAGGAPGSPPGPPPGGMGGPRRVTLTDAQRREALIPRPVH